MDLNDLMLPLLVMLPQVLDVGVLQNVAAELRLEDVGQGRHPVLRAILAYLNGEVFAAVNPREAEERLGAVTAILVAHLDQIKQEEEEARAVEANVVQGQVGGGGVVVPEAAPEHDQVAPVNEDHLLNNVAAGGLNAPIRPAGRGRGGPPVLAHQGFQFVQQPAPVPGIGRGRGIARLPVAPAAPVAPFQFANGQVPAVPAVPVDQGLRIGRLQELRLKGRIGKPGDADKLDFHNISHQIQSAVARGYSEPEIVAAVLSACDARELRGYFERIPNLELAFVVQLLRDWFHVKDSASVMTTMQNAIQPEGDTALQFCMTLMGMRQDVMTLSQQEEFQYDPQLVQMRFQHALYTGLKDGALRQQLKPLLVSNIMVSDADLFRQISAITLVEREHETKLGNAREAAKLQAQINQLQNLEKAKKDEDKPEKSPTLRDEFVALRAQVNELTSLMKDHQFFRAQPMATACGTGGGSAAAGGGGNNGGGGGGNNGGGGGGNNGGGGGNSGGRNNGNRDGVRRNNFTPYPVCSRCRQSDPDILSCNHCFKCFNEGHKKDQCPENH